VDLLETPKRKWLQLGLKLGYVCGRPILANAVGRRNAQGGECSSLVVAAIAARGAGGGCAAEHKLWRHFTGGTTRFLGTSPPPRPPVPAVAESVVQ
jgi:hypothetical protein